MIYLNDSNELFKRISYVYLICTCVDRDIYGGPSLPIQKKNKE